MNKKISLGLAISLVAIVATLAITLTYQVAINTFESRMSSITDRQTTYDLITEIDAKIRQAYAGKISESALREGVAEGFISGLGNDNCDYLTASEWELESDRAAGYDFGLGIDVSRASDGNIRVDRVNQGSPAAKAGLKKGDIITYVDGTTVLSMGYDKAVANIAAATSVKLKVSRSTGDSTYTVTKAKFEIVSVEYKSIGKIGYIEITDFNAGTPNQFVSALNNLQKSGAIGLIIDLRGCASNGYEYACSILDTLLPAGKLMVFTDNMDKRETLYTSDTRSVNLPMCVLVGPETSGAAELFAGAVFDFGKGNLVGTTTAGHFTVEESFVLSDGSAVRLSTGTWSTTASLAVRDGVLSPDFEVLLTSYQESNRLFLTADEDPQITTAIELINAHADELSASDV